jgi:hypothetical protein
LLGRELNEHLEHDCGLTVFQHASTMGLEGDCLEAAGIALASGRSPDWLKFKNQRLLRWGGGRGRNGVGDYRYPQSLQGTVAQTPRLALTGFRKLDNLSGDRVTGRTDGPVGVLEDHKGHFESDAHETDRLGIKSMAVQVGPDWHGGGMLIQFTQL